MANLLNTRAHRSGSWSSGLSHPIWTMPSCHKLSNSQPVGLFLTKVASSAAPAYHCSMTKFCTHSPIAIPTTRKLKNELIRTHDRLPRDASPPEGSSRPRGVEGAENGGAQDTHVFPMAWGFLWLKEMKDLERAKSCLQGMTAEM